MKKVILSLGAMLVFGIASAQTQPVTPGAATTTKKQATTSTSTDVTTQTKNDTRIKPDAVDKNTIDPVDGTQSRKDKVITNDHVKSTSTTKTGTDAASVKKSKTAKKVKQGY